MVRWTYAFLDRSWDGYARAGEFWTRVTGTALSAPRGEFEEFATLLPESGDASVKTQAVGDAGGTHVDLCTADVPGLVRRAVELGARLVVERDRYCVLASPGGVAVCAVPWHGEANRPAAVTAHDGSRSRVAQIAVDVPEAYFAEEVGFWAGLTGWTSVPGPRPEFHVVQPPPAMPHRILVHRLDSDRVAGAHVDLDCSDPAATRRLHETLGADVVGDYPHWTVMRDPAGGIYCLTGRDPDHGGPPGR